MRRPSNNRAIILCVSQLAAKFCVSKSWAAKFLSRGDVVFSRAVGRNHPSGVWAPPSPRQTRQPPAPRRAQRKTALQPLQPQHARTQLFLGLDAARALRSWMHSNSFENTPRFSTVLWGVKVSQTSQEPHRAGTRLFLGLDAAQSSLSHPKGSLSWMHGNALDKKRHQCSVQYSGVTRFPKHLRHFCPRRWHAPSNPKLRAGARRRGPVHSNQSKY